ncbi:hypothetical protein MLD38_008661 [Melastoma candidum]|nr:hypothetical protein MLD38_008661 [Melastoma candidum]
MINPWTTEEREVFLDKLATFGKDFKRIASFLDHKTTADCVEFYYKNHKSDSFERTMSKLNSGKRGKSLSTNTYLKTSEKRCAREINSIPLEVLGAASVIVSESDKKMLDYDVGARAVPFTGDGRYNSRLSRTDCVDDTSSFGAYASEREALAADILAGIGCSLSSEVMSSCITTSVDPAEKGQRRMEFSVRRPLTPDLAEKMEEETETCSGESCGELDPSDWTDEEKSAFIQALSKYGKDFATISRIVGTRSLDQCKVFFSKARKCLGLDLLRPKTSNPGACFSNDANGGDSDSEDARDVETSSAICDDQSGSKMDEDLQLPVADATVVESKVSKSVNVQTDLNETDVDAGTQHYDAVGAKDVKVVVSDDRLLKNGESTAALPGLLQSPAMPFMYADGLGDRVTAGITVRQGAVSMNEKVESKAATSALVNHTVASRVCHDRRKDSLPGEDAVVVSDASPTAHSSTLVDSWKAPSTVSSSCKAFARTSELGVGLRSEPKLKGSFGVTPGGVLAGSLLQEISLSVSQDCSTIPAAPDRALLTAIDLPGSRHVMRNGDQSMIASGNSLLSSYERLRILRGLRVQMPSQGIIANSHGVTLSAVPNFVKTEDNVGQDTSQDVIFGRSGGTNSDGFMAELPLLPPKSEQPNNVPPVLGQSTSEREQNKEKPSGSGDFKLFGQILSHPPMNLKSKSIEENGVHQKVGSKPSALKPCGNRGEDRSSSLPMSDPISSMNLQNVPLRSYGFWDGNRIQTGLPLPDSGILLAKYPAAFGNYPLSPAKLEQLQLQARAKSNDCNSNGLSAFTAREVANNGGIMDYLSSRSREDAKVQPFTIDVKHQPCLDACPDVPRCSTFETIPILQQHQGMGGMIAMNVMGRGGPCNGISDPVAAIKMHYAQSEQYVGQNVNVSIIREDESWRGKGDLGGR